MKSQRTYYLKIELQGKSEPIVITPPITIDFNVVRGIMSSMNTAVINIYNLSENHRAEIFHDWNDIAVYDRVTLTAGYKEDKTAIIFRGNIRSAYSVRQGTNWVTTLDCWDGGFCMTNSQSKLAPTSKYLFKNAVADLVKDMKNVSLGAISSFGSQVLSDDRGSVLTGDSWKLLTDLNVNGINCIDLEKVYALKDDEYVKSNTEYVINADTGLLGTPRREQAYVVVRTLFEPTVMLLRMVKLECAEAIYNDRYRVNAITHNGTISEATGGDASTTFTLYSGKIRLGSQSQKDVTLKEVEPK